MANVVANIFIWVFALVVDSAFNIEDRQFDSLNPPTLVRGISPDEVGPRSHQLQPNLGSLSPVLV